MVFENAPVFNAAGNGLAAFFAINFAVDLEHALYCEGGWQGDRKEARSLYIDNYNNNFAISVKTRNGTVKCPAYSQGYVSLVSGDTLLVTAESFGSADMTLFTEMKPPGFQARGNPPVPVTDPFFSKVIGLYHFEGSGRATTDNSSGGFGTFNLSQIASIDNVNTNQCYVAFGQTALFESSNNATPAQSTIQKSLLQDSTIEFVLYAASTNIAAASAIKYVLDVAGVWISINKLSNTTYNVNITLDGGATTVFTSYILNILTPYRIAIVFLGSQVSLFVNGLPRIIITYIGSLAMPAVMTGYLRITCAAFDSWNISIDELRVTNFPRYQLGYSVATSPFPDQ